MSEIFPEQVQVARTPGQAAYEAYAGDEPHGAYGKLGIKETGRWAAAAEAAVDESESPLPAQLAMAQEAVSDLAAERGELRAQLGALAATWEAEAAEFAAEAKRDYNADPELSHRERETADHYRERASELRALLGERAGQPASASQQQRHDAQGAGTGDSQ